MRMSDTAIPGGTGPALMTAAVALVMVVSMASWVYGDAKEQAKNGNPVVFSTSSFELNTPARWLLCCLLLGELFIPLYIDSRSPGS